MTFKVTVAYAMGDEPDDFYVSAVDADDAEAYVRPHLPDDWSSFTVERADA
jgi:hypothetical protein